MDKKELIEQLSSVACSDGNCIFKLFLEQKNGQHTNGGCHCLDGLDISKRRVIRLLLQQYKKNILVTIE